MPTVTIPPPLRSACAAVSAASRPRPGTAMASHTAHGMSTVDALSMSRSSFAISKCSAPLGITANGDGAISVAEVNSESALWSLMLDTSLIDGDPDSTAEGGQAAFGDTATGCPVIAMTTPSLATCVLL